MSAVIECCKRAKDATEYCAQLTTEQKNQMLRIIADTMTQDCADILAGNAIDLADKNLAPHLADRLMLNETRLKGIAEGVETLIELDDPIGTVIEQWDTAVGLHIQKVRVPLGVIGIIYEARPNVTVDAIALCLKTGNAVVLRGSSSAINSNKAIVKAITNRLNAAGFRSDFICLIEDLTHAGAEELMRCREYVDVIIPRGSAALIENVVKKSSVAVIETGAGNCHAYIEKSGDLKTAIDIILNGKLQRPSVCNALESVLIDRDCAKSMLPEVVKALKSAGVEVRGCAESVKICPDIIAAVEDDYYREFLSLTISVKVVSDYNEAIEHINKCGTHHSDTIISANDTAIEQFLNRVDSAAVYANASTRFTDGFVFGFGAEMGISTQKLHARGPMGLRELTSYKYKIKGNGQIRQ